MPFDDGASHPSEDGRVVVLRGTLSDRRLRAMWPDAKQTCEVCVTQSRTSYSTEVFWTAPLPCAHTLCARCYTKHNHHAKRTCPVDGCAVKYNLDAMVPDSSRAQIIFEQESQERLLLCRVYGKTLDDFVAEAAAAASEARGARARFAAYLDERESMVFTLVHGCKADADALRAKLSKYAKEHATEIEARVSTSVRSSAESSSSSQQQQQQQQRERAAGKRAAAGKVGRAPRNRELERARLVQLVLIASPQDWKRQRQEAPPRAAPVAAKRPRRAADRAPRRALAMLSASSSPHDKRWDQYAARTAQELLSALRGGELAIA